MNRTDRLLAIVLELQAKKQVRAEDLAATFEVSKRTIYRDMLALDESGVPIVSIPGQGYSLVEGYFLPPLSFNTNEAIMLLLGADFVAQNFDAQYRRAAESASHKIVSVLPEELRQEVEYLQRSIQFISFNELSAPDTLKQLRNAIIERKTVRFGYHARYRSDQTSTAEVREVDPYALIHVGGGWMLIAYCHLRRDIRHFRLERMEDIVTLEKGFTRPHDFEIQRSSDDDRTLVVRALFDHEAARRIQEAPSFYQMGQEAHPDGLLVTLAVLQGHTGVVFGVRWSSGGLLFASSEWDNRVHLWDSGTGNCLEVLQHPTDEGNYFYGLAWSPDGTLIAGGGDDGTVNLWDAETGELLRRLAGHHSMITSVIWNPKGTYVASGSSGIDNGELFVWDPYRADRVASFGESSGIVSAAAWGSDEDMLINGGGDGILRWWHLPSGQSVLERETHHGTIQALRRSPDGTKLASCGDDGAIAIWDLYSGDCLQRLRRDRPYERLNITGIRGLTGVQKESLKALGAVEVHARGTG